MKIILIKDVGSLAVGNWRLFKPKGTELKVSDYNDVYYRIDPSTYPSDIPHTWLIDKSFTRILK